MKGFDAQLQDLSGEPIHASPTRLVLAIQKLTSLGGFMLTPRFVGD